MAQTTLDILVNTKFPGAAHLNQQLANIGKSAGRSANSIRDMGRAGDFALGALGAFFFYRGFVFLSTQAQMFIGEMVKLQHEVGIVQTQLGHLGKDFRPQIQRNVIDVAQETGMAMSSVAKAEFEVVSANIAVADSYDILRLSAKAAAAGGMQDVELAFNAALSQVNAFDLSNAQFGEVFDKQFNLIKRGIFTYEQFATVVGTVSEAFASMGQDVETVNASLAAISQVFTGKQIERGATGLRNAVLRLSEAPEMFEDLGVAVTDAQGNFRNFIDIGRDLNVVLDGMSEQARAGTIKKLFPDERERRGINAFLGQLEKAEMFYTEQMLAIGDLDDAFQTANESLLQQSRILQQNLIPAIDGVVNGLDGFVSLINDAEDAVPGLTTAVLQLALAMAALGAAGTLGPKAIAGIAGSRAMSSLRLSPRQGPVPLGGYELGAARQANFLKLGGFGAFGAGVVTSKLAGDTKAGALGGGALMGGGAALAMGATPWTAAGFAVGGALISAIKAQRAKEAFEGAGQSMAEAFSEKFQAGAGDMADAFAAALGMAGRGEGVSLNPAALGTGTLTRTETRAEQLDRLSAGGDFGWQEKLRRPMAKLGRSILEGAEDAINFTFDSDVDFLKRREVVEEQFTDVGTAARKAAGALQEFDRRAGDFEGFLDAQQIATLRQQTLNDVLDDLIPANTEVQEQMQQLARILVESEIPVSQFDEGLSILTNAALETGEVGTDALIEFFRFIRKTTIETMPAFEQSLMEFQTSFTGDFGFAADVFADLGAEGAHLAETFRKLSDITQAFTTLEKLGALSTTTPDRVIGQRHTLTQDVLGFQAGRDLPPSVAQWLMQNGMAGLVQTSDVMGGGGTKSIFDPKAIEEASRLFLESALGVDMSAAKNLSGADLYRLLMGGGEDGAVANELVLGANSLADALFEASGLVREGFLDGMGFSADQLEMFGEEMAALNRLVAQRTILEELQAISKFAGVNNDSVFQQAFAGLTQQMKLGGQSFFDIMRDPVKLAELLANMEFNADVNIDRSTTLTIVNRLSGDVSPATIAAVEQATLNAINRSNRERGSR